MSTRKPAVFWGEPPWRIDFTPETRALPAEVDTAIVGGGFSGLAAAAWLRLLDPEEAVAVLEANRFGSGASGRTGGIALAGTAADDLPGLGDVLEGFANILQKLEIECDLKLPGVFEIARSKGRPNSPVIWQDSGALRLVNEVPGGTIDPGKLLDGLGRAAQRLGAILCEGAPARNVRFEHPVHLEVGKRELTARRVLFATNAFSLGLSGLVRHAQAKFALALATAPLEEDELVAIGLGQRKAFYTLDLPYLWGRVLGNRGVVFGSGLVDINTDDELAALDVSAGNSAELLARLEARLRALHPALRSVQVTNRWGGPILFGNAFRPFFDRHPRCPDALVLGGYSGQGVTLSVYLGRWAAEALLGRRDLPAWGRIR